MANIGSVFSITYSNCKNYMNHYVILQFLKYENNSMHLNAFQFLTNRYVQTVSSIAPLQ